MERGYFLAEGKMEIGPKEQFFTMLGGEYLGRLLLKHFELPEELGYTELGRVPITVERLESSGA